MYRFTPRLLVCLFTNGKHTHIDTCWGHFRKLGAGNRSSLSSSSCLGSLLIQTEFFRKRLLTLPCWEACGYWALTGSHV